MDSILSDQNQAEMGLAFVSLFQQAKSSCSETSYPTSWFKKVWPKQTNGQMNGHGARC